MAVHLKALFVCAMFLLPTVSPSAQAQLPTYREGEFVVRLADGGDFEPAVAKFVNSTGAEIIDRIPRFRTVVVRLPVSANAPGPIQTTALKIASNPAVEIMEPNVIFTPATLPNDPGILEMRHIGRLALEQVWEGGPKASGIVIAVIDSGIMLDHEDLTGVFAQNPDEIPGNGIDDDQNDLVDDVVGYDFIDRDSDPSPSNLTLDGSPEIHGTHVTGGMVAKSNNGLGIAGVCPDARIVPIRAITEKGTGNLGTVLSAISYAIERGAHVINASWGTSVDSPQLHDALRQAANAGMLVVAAAGNGNDDFIGDDNDKLPYYPASFMSSLPNVVSVAAVGVDDRLAYFSNFGKESVHLAAYGVAILSTVPKFDGSGLVSGYRRQDGTSMAAPQVSCAAAIIKAQSPTIGVSEWRARIISHAEASQHLSGKLMTDGRLSLAKFVTQGALPATASIAPVVEPVAPLKIRQQGFKGLSSLSTLPPPPPPLPTGSYNSAPDPRDARFAVEGPGERVDLTITVDPGKTPRDVIEQEPGQRITNVEKLRFPNQYNVTIEKDISKSLGTIIDMKGIRAAEPSSFPTMR